MTIDLLKQDGKIMCKVPNEEEIAPLGALGMALMFLSDEQIKEKLGATKPELNITFEMSQKEQKDIEKLKSALDKIYSK